MSELIRIDRLRAHAEQCAREGKPKSACPYKDDPRRAEIWLTYFYAEQEKQVCSA